MMCMWMGVTAEGRRLGVEVFEMRGEREGGERGNDRGAEVYERKEQRKRAER